MKKLFLALSILLLATLAFVACERQEETAPPASQENMERTDTGQGMDREQGTGETAPPGQGGSQ